MKIDDLDFRYLEKLVAAGATAQVIVEVLKEAKQAEKRERERERLQTKRGNNEQKVPTSTNIEQHPPTAETPSQVAERELFNVAKGAMGKRCGGLISSLIRHHNYDLGAARAVVDQAITKADPREYLVASMRSSNGQQSDISAAKHRLVARAKDLEREAGLGEPEDATFPGFGGRR